MAKSRWRAMQALGLACAFSFSLLALTVAKAQVTYEYDSLGRLKKTTYTQDSEVITYMYDAAGNRSSVTVSGVADAELSISAALANESDPLEFTVTRAGNLSSAVSVDYATSDGSATSSDYTTTSGTLSFAANDATKTITVPTVQDQSYEGNETLTVTLSNMVGSGSIITPSAVGTIDDSADAPSFSVSDASADEGASITFTVARAGATATAHDVNFATSTGSAAAGDDFISTAGTLSFLAGEISKNITVATNDDSDFELDETFSLTLSAPTNGASLGTAIATGTITNNDTGPVFSISDVTVTEGGAAQFTITKSGATGLSLSVDYATADGSASAGSDYTGVSATTLSFGASETSKQVTISTTDDTVDEPNETFYVNLSNATAGATISDSQGVATLNDNDAGPAFSVNDVSVSEGGNLVFTVSKSGSTSQSFSVSYATANGTASTGDYTGTSGSLTFTSAQSSKTVTVATTQDSTIESNETVLLNLSSPSAGSTISDSQGVGTINNDDVNTAPVAVNDSGSTEVFQNAYVYPLSNDIDTDGHTISYVSHSASSPSGATATWNSSLKRMTLGSDSSGTYQFTYNINDGHGGTDQGIITLTVTDPPNLCEFPPGSGFWIPC